ncbi:ScbA/BarX family gamma-butyrolactone biosynthesis protein [Streptomyces sp. NBC_01217]|uniref:ScbA/BarX family gamma-butyrolactone biosynthesis protein n=1 Tax=Streptomyces sp. NBC_01217 TaxID=2903779 RepID=UPI002E0D3582|nr:gamma-butyrolactone biosynthesis protein [Streptomyces sp. NBC_01217]
MPNTLSPELSYTRTVARSLVHRAAICEVFLTDASHLSDNEYLIAAQLPRVHSYYSDHITAPASYDPLLLVEVFRQASIYVAHRFLDAPIESKFSFNSGDMTVTDPQALRIGGLPGRVEIHATQASLKHRESVVTGSGLDLVLTIDGREAATMRTVTQWMPPAAWNRLREKGRAALTLSPVRSHHTGRRIAPVTVGRSTPQNVVLSEAVVNDCELRAHVIVDQANPALFDHPLDHIPGALIFEAYRQTAVHAAHELFGLSPRGLLLTRVETDFTRFGEFELPTDCLARVVESPAADTVAFEITMVQEADTIARARVHLTRTSPLPNALLNRFSSAAV